MRTDEPLAVSPEEAGRMVGVTRQTIHKLVRSGALPAAKVGRSTRITVDSIRALVGLQPEVDRLVDSAVEQGFGETVTDGEVLRAIASLIDRSSVRRSGDAA